MIIAVRLYHNMQGKTGFILQLEVKLCYTIEHVLNDRITVLIRSFVLFEELGRL